MSVSYRLYLLEGRARASRLIRVSVENAVGAVWGWVEKLKY